MLDGCTQVPTYTLESAIGTYLQQREIGSSATTLGTSLIVKLRADGATLTTKATVELTGPPTWNVGKPYKEIYSKGSQWAIFPIAEATPLIGEYHLSVTLAGQRLDQILTLSAITQLELANVSAVQQGTTISATWPGVPKAQGYYARLFYTNDGNQVGTTIYTLQPQVTLTAPRGNYALGVYTVNFDVVSGDPSLPETLLVSDSITQVIQESGAAKKGVHLTKTFYHPALFATNTSPSPQTSRGQPEAFQKIL
jgi:hypothetical protein